MFLKPFRIKSNVTCKGSEKRKLKCDLMSLYPNLSKDDLDEIMPAKSLVSIIRLVTYGGVVVTTYHCNDQPIFFDHESVICPSVYTLWKYQDMLTSVIIIQQTLSRLQNGADLMLPGIVAMNKRGQSILDLKEGQYCAIKIKDQDIYGMGRCLMSGEQMMRNRLRGRGVKMLHLHGDLLWEMGPMTTPLDAILHTRIRDPCGSPAYKSTDHTPKDEPLQEKSKYRSSREDKANDPYYKEFREATIAAYHLTSEMEKRAAITRALEQRKIYMEGLPPATPPDEPPKEGRSFGRGAFDSLSEYAEASSMLTTPHPLLDDIVNDLDEVGVSVPDEYRSGVPREATPISCGATSTSDEDEDEDDDSLDEDRNQLTTTSEDEGEESGGKGAINKGVVSDVDGIVGLDDSINDIVFPNKGVAPSPLSKKEEEFDDIGISLPQKYTTSTASTTSTSSTSSTRSKSRSSGPGVWPSKEEEEGEERAVSVPRKESLLEERGVGVPRKEKEREERAVGVPRKESLLKEERAVGVPRKESLLQEERAVGVPRKESLLQEWTGLSKERSGFNEESEFDEIGISLPQEYQSESCDSSEKEVESEGEWSSHLKEEPDEATPKSWYSIPLKHGATPTTNRREEDSTSSHDMDQLLQECFMTALKVMSKVKSPQASLPLLTSTFYRSSMVPLCPVHMKLDVKKSNYKKFSRFLLEMQTKGVIKLGETVKGSEVISNVDFKHPLVKSFTPRILPSTDVDTELTSATKPLQISTLYMPSHRLATFFRQLGFTKASIMDYQQVRESVIQYIKENKLVNSDDPKQVFPDPVLGDALYKGGSGNPHKAILRQELMKMIFEEMKPAYSIKYGNAPAVIKRGKLESVKLTLAQRMGNKKVTLVDNLEVYGIPANDLAQSMQKLAAASTTVCDVPGRPSARQVLIQGNAIKVVAKVLQDSYGLPIKHIEAVDKVKPSKTKKKRKK